MGGHEAESLFRRAHNPQDSDVDSVPEVLLPEVFGDRATLAHRPDVELLAIAGGEPALRGEGGNASEHGLIGVLELDQQELPVHWDALELLAVGQGEVGVKFHASLLEAAKDADDLLFWEQLRMGHDLVSPPRGIGIPELEFVQCVRPLA